MALTFTRNWRLRSTDVLLTRLLRLNGELASSLSCLVDTERAALRLFAPLELGLTARLSILLTSKGLLHVTYTEELTPPS